MNNRKIRALIREWKEEIRDNNHEIKVRARNAVYGDAAHLQSINIGLAYIINRLENLLKERD